MLIIDYDHAEEANTVWVAECKEESLRFSRGSEQSGLPSVTLCSGLGVSGFYVIRLNVYIDLPVFQ
jgi:hypothetical protein